MGDVRKAFFLFFSSPDVSPPPTTPLSPHPICKASLHSLIHSLILCSPLSFPSIAALWLYHYYTFQLMCVCGGGGARITEWVLRFNSGLFQCSSLVGPLLRP